MTVLVSGGTGVLGRSVVPALSEAGHPVRVSSRHPPTGGDVDWVQVDLSTGEGLPEAVADIDTVVHLASAPYRGPYTTRVDVQGTARLTAAARSAGVRHLVFVSIVGVDVVPWGYFRQKLAAERVVRHGGIGWSILRLPQFHPFLDRALSMIERLPTALTDAGISAQPVDPSDAALPVVRRVERGPSETIEEVAGPEVLDGEQLVTQWLRARGRPIRVRSIRVPGRLGRAFRSGGLTSDAQRTGSITWSDYLAARYRTNEADSPTVAEHPATPTAGPNRSMLRPARKRQAVLWFERNIQNPAVRGAARAGVPLPMFALLETIGRRSGEPRQIPLINGLDGDTFWIVAEHGRHAAYVKNLEANPRVRVRTRRRWRSGTAHILEDDDPFARASWMRSLGRWHAADALAIRLLGTEPLSIRVDLDPEG